MRVGPGDFRARLFIDSQTRLPITVSWQARTPPARGGTPGGPPACTSPADPSSPGVTVISGGGTATVQSFDQNSQRFREQVFVQARNITNRASCVGYSGVMTSRFLGQPAAVLGTRKVDKGRQFSL